MQKKSTKASQQQTVRAQLLVSAVSILWMNDLCQMVRSLCLINSVNQEDADAGQMSGAVVQECSGSVRVSGAVHCRAYIHNNKPKTRHAAQVSTTSVLLSVLWLFLLSSAPEQEMSLGLPLYNL